MSVLAKQQKVNEQIMEESKIVPRQIVAIAEAKVDEINSFDTVIMIDLNEIREKLELVRSKFA